MSETTTVAYLTLRYASPQTLQVAASDQSGTVQIEPPPSPKAIPAPFETTSNVPATFGDVGTAFYIRAGGTYPVMQYGDQYAAIFEKSAMPDHGSIIVKLENPDMRTSWQGRAGIMVRGDIAKPGEPGPYLILASSPAAGSYLEWATNGSRRG